MKISTTDPVALKNATLGSIVISGDGSPAIGSTPTVCNRPVDLLPGTNPPPTPPPLPACESDINFSDGFAPPTISGQIADVLNAASGPSTLNGSRTYTHTGSGIFESTDAGIFSTIQVTDIGGGDVTLAWDAFDFGSGDLANGVVTVPMFPGALISRTVPNDSTIPPGNTEQGQIDIAGGCAP